MKIMNNKGKKEHVSTFFHSKDTENEFKKYFMFFSFLLGFLFFLTALIIFTIIDDVLIALPLVVILGIILYILKDRYITSIVTTVMSYAKSRHGEKNEKTSKYQSLTPTKKNISHKKRNPNSFTNKVKEKFFKQKESEQSYIEIK